MEQVKPQQIEGLKIFEVQFKDDESTIKSFKINYVQLIAYLSKLGFYRYDHQGAIFYLKIKNNQAEEITQEEIIDDFLKRLKLWPEKVYFPRATVKLQDREETINHETPLNKEFILNKLLSGLDTYFKPKILNRLQKVKQDQFLEDQRRRAFMFFKNGFLEITDTYQDFLSYDHLEKLIWKSQILPYDYQPETDYKSGVFYAYCTHISGAYTNTEYSQRLLSLQTLIGYNLHKYYEGKLKATIFTDSRISEEANGRSGKTLLCKAIGIALNSNKDQKIYTEINGKTFDVNNKHKYQSAALETRLICLNDIQHFGRFRFYLENLFNDITEGIEVDKKNKDPFTIQVKLVINTNRTLKIEGDSAADRVTEYELSDFYSAQKSPADVFKHWFFTDWSQEEYSRFFSFMIHCIQTYLKEGIIKPKSINLDQRKLIDHTSEDFINWIEDKFLTGELHKNQPFDKRALFTDLVENYPDLGHKFTQRRFTKFLRIYTQHKAGFKPFTSKEKTSWEYRSNGKDYFTFLDDDSTPF